MFTPAEIVIAVVVLALLVFVPILRRLLGLIVRLAVFFIAVGIVAAGVTMIMNNETIFERPGLGQHVVRFLTMNSAAASQTGSGAVTCGWRGRRRHRRPLRLRRINTPQKKKLLPALRTPG